MSLISSPMPELQWEPKQHKANRGNLEVPVKCKPVKAKLMVQTWHVTELQGSNCPVRPGLHPAQLFPIFCEE